MASQHRDQKQLTMSQVAEEWELNILYEHTQVTC